MPENNPLNGAVRPPRPILSLSRRPTAGQAKPATFVAPIAPAAPAPRRSVVRTGQRYLDIAALQLLRDLDSGRAGEEIPVPALAPAWKKTGLRSADLDHAIMRLSDAGFLRMSDDGGQATVVVQPKGERRMRSLAVGISAEVQIRYHMNQLEAGDRRRLARPPPGQHRRRSDHALTA
jgi:hypothetical protein